MGERKRFGGRPKKLKKIVGEAEIKESKFMPSLGDCEEVNGKGREKIVDMN